MRCTILALTLAACAAPTSAPQTEALVAAGSGPAAPVAADTPHARGAVVYVPVYSSVYVAEGDQVFDLTVTLTVRNTDRAAPITVSAVNFYDTGGKLLHAYVDAPTSLAPLASADTVVRASDTRAGVGGSFVVEWRAGSEVTEPVVEAVMIGAGYQQGISFVSRGTVLERVSGAAPAP